MPATTIGASVFGQDVAEHDGQVAHADGPGALGELLVLERQDVRADDPRQLHPAQHADHHDEGPGIGAEQDGEHDHEEHDRDAEQGVGHAHDQGVEPAAVVASDGAEPGPDGDGDDRGQDTDREGDAGRVHQAGEEIAADLVGAEGMLADGVCSIRVGFGSRAASCGIKTRRRHRDRDLEN